MAADVISLLLAGVLGLAGAAKLFDLRGTSASLRDFAVPVRLVEPFALLLPLGELAIAVALLVPATAQAGAAAAVALFALFTLAVAASLARGRRPDCGCLGKRYSRPIGVSALARTTVLAALASALLVLDPAGVAAVDARAWLGLAVIAQAVFIVALLRRQADAAPVGDTAHAPLAVVDVVRTPVAVGAATVTAAALAPAAGAATADDAAAYRELKRIIRATSPRIVAREKRFATAVTRLMAAADKDAAKFTVLAEIALLKKELRRAYEQMGEVVTPDYRRGEKNPSRIAKSDAVSVLRLLEVALDRFVTTLNAKQQRRRVALYDETAKLLLDAEHKRRALARRLGCTKPLESC